MPGEVHEIKLKLKSNGRIDLPPGHVKKAYRSDIVIWMLKDNSIDSFKIVTKDGYNTDMFVNPPYRIGSSWVVEVKSSVSQYNYQYNIVYWPKGSKDSLVLDPTIAIKPGSQFLDFGFLIPLIAGIALGVVGTFVGRKFFSK